MPCSPTRQLLHLLRGALGAAVAIALLAPSGANADSIVLRWTAPGDDGNVGRASGYELRYSATPVLSDTVSWWNNTALSAGALPPPLTAGSAESFAVAGLNPSTTYYFVIRTSDEVPNVAGFSNVLAKSTSSGGTLDPPTSFAAVPVTGGVQLTWDEVTASSALGYRLYRRAGGSGLGALVFTATITQTAWIDTTVVGGTTYDYSITSYSNTAESAPASVTISVPTGGLPGASTSMVGYPNPASGKVTLRFLAGTADGSPGPVKLIIYDLQGHKIRELVDEELPAGERSIVWLCQSDTGNRVAPGLYNAILDSPRGRQVARLAILP